MEFSALRHKSNTYYVGAKGQVKSINIVLTVLWKKKKKKKRPYRQLYVLGHSTLHCTLGLLGDVQGANQTYFAQIWFS